jgi:uncharacterized protein YoxC
MEMSILLQMVLFVAALAVIVLVACLLPIAFQVRRQVEQLMLTAMELKASVQVLLQESRELVRSASELSQRARQEMDEAGQVVHTVRQWTERADRLVDEVGAAIEPPIFALTRNMNLIRMGVSAFMQNIFQRHQRKAAEDTNNPTNEEDENHVGE